VPWIEENSGVDITPCHDVDGTWNPTPACQGFAVDTLETSVEWDDWCETPRLGPAATCGPAFDAKPDDTAPTVRITEPTAGSVFDGPQATLTVTVDAHDEGPGVKSVVLEINGEAVATDERAPWEFANARFPAGSWTLVAVAEDWSGNIGASEPVAIGVGQEPPEVPMDGEDEDGDSESETGGDPGIDADDGCSCTAARGDARMPLAMVLTLLGLARIRRRT
jgi:MYXO-CTERM domain-containing protein